jgi:transcriptional regulator with XRE-family HTH domain
MKIDFPKTNGENSRTRKLDQRKVKAVRRLARFGLTQKRIAELMNVTPPTICNILRGATWND